MSFMYNKCHKLKELKGINNFKTNKVICMKGMFQGCYELEYLDLSNFNTSNVINLSFMFNQCTKLKQIIGIINFNISKVINKEEMFEKCNELEFLLLSKFNIKQDINQNYKKQLDEEKKKNLKLLDELNNQKKMIELMKTSEKAIAVNFSSIDQTIIYPISCMHSDIFLKVEEKLYQEFPELRKKNIVFIANGNIINREITLE